MVVSNGGWVTAEEATFTSRMCRGNWHFRMHGPCSNTCHRQSGSQVDIGFEQASAQARREQCGSVRLSTTYSAIAIVSNYAASCNMDCKCAEATGICYPFAKDSAAAALCSSKASGIQIGQVNGLLSQDRLWVIWATLNMPPSRCTHLYANNGLGAMWVAGSLLGLCCSLAI